MRSTTHQRKHDRRFRKALPTVAVAAALIASGPAAALASSGGLHDKGKPVVKHSRQSAALVAKSPDRGDSPQETFNN
jgi:hypothetical protein